MASKKSKVLTPEDLTQLMLENIAWAKKIVAQQQLVLERIAVALERTADASESSAKDSRQLVKSATPPRPKEIQKVRTVGFKP